jgi:hypothetical protein
LLLPLPLTPGAAGELLMLVLVLDLCTPELS